MFEGVHVQATLRNAWTLTGTGLHSGAPVRLTVLPAPAGAGIAFRRTDLVAAGMERGAATIAARWDNVVPVPLCTRLVNASGVGVSTVEHLMAALAGCGIHNALVEVSGPELPILDGSAAPFVAAILAAGPRLQDAPLRVLRILAPVEVRGSDGARARLAPWEGFEIAFEIAFADRAIGTQRLALEMGNGRFVHDLCDSRTFCRRSDVEAMRAAGLALGGTLDNAVVVDGAKVLTPGGLRRSDEPVRHKMLDALGDLALAGGPIRGAYAGQRAGHALTNRLLRELFATEGAWTWEDADPAFRDRLPGMGVTLADLPAVA